MEKNSASQSRVFNPRVCVALLLCSGGVSLAMLGSAVSTTSSEIISTDPPLTSPSAPSVDAQKCTALAGLNLEDAPGGPALITSARLLEVPTDGLEPPFFHPSGYASAAGQRATKIKQY